MSNNPITEQSTQTEETYIPKQRKNSNVSVILNGTSSLCEQRLVKPSKKKAQAKPEIKTKIYKLREVTEEQLFELRKSGVPGFVLKANGTYYYAKIRKAFKIPDEILPEGHRCAMSEDVCQRLSAAPEHKGGCQKVRDFSIDHLVFDQFSDERLNEILRFSKRIEKYPFITKGYETFNTNLNLFMVAECDHYVSCRGCIRYI